MFDEGFVEHQARPGLDPAQPSALDPKTAAQLPVGVCAAIGPPAVYLEWAAGRAPAAGASEDELAGMLLAIAPVARLSRVARACADPATALGHDIAAALEEPDDPRQIPWPPRVNSAWSPNEADMAARDRPSGGRSLPRMCEGGQAR